VEKTNVSLAGAIIKSSKGLQNLKRGKKREQMLCQRIFLACNEEAREMCGFSGPDTCPRL
jgi:hypothetical protein